MGDYVGDSYPNIQFSLNTSPGYCGQRVKFNLLKNRDRPNLCNKLIHFGEIWHVCVLALNFGPRQPIKFCISKIQVGGNLTISKTV